MTATAKTVNYTAEQEALIAEMAGASENGMLTAAVAEMLAAEFGKTVKSVVAKLSRMGVYQKKVYTTKTGDAVVKKDTLADKLAEIVGLSEAETDSLTKANKTALAKIIAKLEG
jgi:response regulator RpfG family c-di-GMP phosphodiesterase